MRAFSSVVCLCAVLCASSSFAGGDGITTEMGRELQSIAKKTGGTFIIQDASTSEERGIDGSSGSEPVLSNRECSGSSDLGFVSFQPIDDSDAEKVSAWANVKDALSPAGDSEHWARFKRVSKRSGKIVAHSGAIAGSFLVDAGLGLATSVWHLIKNTGNAFWNSQLSVPKILKNHIEDAPKWSPPSLPQDAGLEEISERFARRVLMGFGITTLNVGVFVVDGAVDLGKAVLNAGGNIFHAIQDGEIARPVAVKTLCNA